MCCGVHGAEMIVRIDPEDTDKTLKERYPGKITKSPFRL